MTKFKHLFSPFATVLLLLWICTFFLYGICYASTPRQKYFAAENCYKELNHSPSKKKYRHYWINCIDKYQNIFKKHPESGWAPAGMYRSAQLYLELYKYSYAKKDRQEAVDLLRRIQKRYPQSAYTKRADNILKRVAANNNSDKPKTIPSRKKRTQAEKTETAVFQNTEIEKNEKSKGNISKRHQSGQQTNDTLITGLRFWSNPEYTRVVIDADQERNYRHKLLKKDPSINVHFKRLYVDIENSKLGQNVPSHTTIDDDLLKQARAGQHTRHSVRVVIDIKSFDNYKIFSLNDPFRIVMDIWGESESSSEKPSGTDDKEFTGIVSLDNLKSSNITKQLALGVTNIIIDPGHGGRDPGCPGYFKGVWEKNVTLELAKNLAEQLRDKLKCNVLLTRSKDHYLTLEERTAIANTKKADLFISLHCNGAKNKRLSGIETYFLNLATDERAIAVAAKENATSKKNISDLESILNDLMKNAKIKESSRLAENVQDSIITGMRNNYSRINNLGVKQAPFYVLIGARMPSILIESSFISNKRECKRMMDTKYKDRLCESISSGIEQYIKETNPQFL